METEQTAEPTVSTPMAKSTASPEPRSSSPSPSVSPSFALDAVPNLDRSASTPTSSTVSTLSSQSIKSRRLSDGPATVGRRRGYMRPQGTAFADSARNRDSVMSLGSIAHMQYYFARTGLLDGKGAQLAKEKDMKRLLSMVAGKENMEPYASSNGDELSVGAPSLHDTNYAYAVSDPGQDYNLVESPSELTESSNFWNASTDPPMLPPTVSTYKQKPSYTEPLPDMPVLRRELKEALQDACKVLEETQKTNENGQSEVENDGFYELQGLHLLDIITLAIRAAKNYYTAHTNPQQLYAIKSEKNIRSELYQVLDVLKRMASRNFRGGMRPMELVEVIMWIESIDQLIKKEEQRELEEVAEREAFAWREGDWTDREREREWSFLKSFDPELENLPPWTEPALSNTSPTPFLEALRDGRRLVRLHNALVERSKRKFDEIKTWHTDVAKPYRMAENLRFWVKAAELRWEVRLTVPVMDVVNGKSDGSVWQAFDNAVLEWCRVVREELTEEWRQEKAAERRRMPEVKVELPDDNNLLLVKDVRETSSDTTAATVAAGNVGDVSQDTTTGTVAVDNVGDMSQDTTAATVTAENIGDTSQDTTAATVTAENVGDMSQNTTAATITVENAGETPQDATATAITTY